MPTSSADTTEQMEAYRQIVFDWPTSPPMAVAVVLLMLGILSYVVWMYRRDTRQLARGWSVLLLTLRVIAWTIVAALALHPRERTQTVAWQPSRVVILADTSLSMRHPLSDDQAASSSTTVVPNNDPVVSELFPAGISRSDAVIRLLSESSLLKELRRTHEVSVLGFDGTVRGPLAVISHEPNKNEPNKSTEEAERETLPTEAEWRTWLSPTGPETRLGDAVSELVRRGGGRGLTGLVLLTDGASNSGLDPLAMIDRANQAKVRLITIGCGSTRRSLNFRLAEVRAPSEVQLGDPFDIVGVVTGEGADGREFELRLLEVKPGAAEPTLVESKTLSLGPDEPLKEASFTVKPLQTGTSQYTLSIQSLVTRETLLDDNAQQASVVVSDRPLKVLLFASGPLRDYQFVRNLMFRHKGMSLDLCLQSAGPGTSQESHRQLLAFPETREALYQYDAIIAFDPDWSAVPTAALEHLTTWLAEEAGGLIVVAGDLHTPRLAMRGPNDGDDNDPRGILREMLPVMIGALPISVGRQNEYAQPMAIEFTDEGRRAAHLQLADEPQQSLAVWQRFPGIHRYQPTTGEKAGATVLARVVDPRAEKQEAILLASQFLGQGRVFYVGSPEVWRLRSLSEELYDRFWVKATRDVTQGRSRRGDQRGSFLPESRRVLLGQAIRLRARLLDTRFEPLTTAQLQASLFDPSGRAVPSPVVLRADRGRPGEYQGEFRPNASGIWRVELPMADSTDRLVEEFTVLPPRLEDDNLRQQATLLARLAEETQGAYLPIQEAADQLPALLPSRAEQTVVDDRLVTLWDRGSVLACLVGVLSLEWLIRKLLRLA